MNPWWWLAIALALWWGAWFYHAHPVGRHRLYPSVDACPVGQVWFHDGIWWTFCRRQWGRVPRRFEERSNPLDHEERVVKTWQECRTRHRYAEVEY